MGRKTEKWVFDFREGARILSSTGFKPGLGVTNFLFHRYYVIFMRKAGSSVGRTTHTYVMHSCRNAENVSYLRTLLYTPFILYMALNYAAE
jgi:hypothetical protein